MAMGDFQRGREARNAQRQTMEPLEGRVLLSTATLDPSFAVSSVGPLDSRQLVEAQADGKILVAGVQSGPGWQVTRYNANGRLDKGFGTKGVAVVSGIDTMEAVGCLAIQVQSDGKILLGGTEYDPGAQRYVLARLLANGQMDQSFGDGGIVHTPITMYGYYGGGTHMGLALQGKRIVVGTTWDHGDSGDLAVLCYTETGALYKKFGKRGFTSVDFGGNDALGAMAMDSQGKILVGGVTTTARGTYWALARLGANGKLDPSFHKDGKVTADLGSHESIDYIGVQTNGRIVVAGERETAVDSGQYSTVLVRYKATGAGDKTFGTKGIVNMGRLGGEMVLEESGAITFTEAEEQNLVVIRYTANGKVDQAFGSHGVQGLALGGTLPWNAVVDATLDSNGKVLALVLGGSGISVVPFKLVRYGIA